jgi:hypothetical protein
MPGAADNGRRTARRRLGAASIPVAIVDKGYGGLFNE